MTNGKIEEEDGDIPVAGMSHKQFNSYLLKKIYDFWADKGYIVRVWMLPEQTADPKSVLWTIKSDLCDGLPNRNPQQDTNGSVSRVLSPPVFPQRSGIRASY